MKKSFLTLATAITTLALGSTAAHAAVTLIQENFDGYGSANVALSGQSGGSGFGANNWTAASGGSNGYTATNLTVGTSGYTNTGATGANDGSSSNNGFNSGVGTIYSYRSTGLVSSTTFASANTTAWFSALVRVGDTATGNNVFLGFEGQNAALFPSGSVTTGITAGVFKTNSTNGAAVTANTTYLITGRFTSGGTGNNDTIDIWYNPTALQLTTLASSALGAGDFTSAAVDLKLPASGYGFGEGIQVGARGASNNFIDSVRFAYGDTSANNFESVMTGVAVPEPTTAVMLLGGLGALALLRRRRATV